MATQHEAQELLDLFAALHATMADNLRDNLIESPHVAEAITELIDSVQGAAENGGDDGPPPADGGLGQLAGVGSTASDELGDTRLPPPVEPYDEYVTSERIVAMADLYYLYQHEKIGIFRAVRKLRELFRAGAVRLSSGEGAFRLYQFDRREVLRSTRLDRLAAYRRAFGYGGSRLTVGALPNNDFHHLFSHFINQVAFYWSDKRISDVIRERAHDPSFGSIAVVRRAGLDLRNNLKGASYGHLNVLRVEVMQLLEEAFAVLGSDDVMRLFGSENAWEVAEDVLRRYLKVRSVSSPRQRMAIAGRNILNWLSQAHLLETGRTQFEALLNSVADDAEEWLTSAQSLGFADRRGRRRVLPWERKPTAAGQPSTSARAARNGRSRQI